MPYLQPPYYPTCRIPYSTHVLADLFTKEYIEHAHVYVAPEAVHIQAKRAVGGVSVTVVSG